MGVVGGPKLSRVFLHHDRRVDGVVLQLEDGPGSRLDALVGLGCLGRKPELVLEAIGHDEGDGERHGDGLARLDLAGRERERAGGAVRDADARRFCGGRFTP